MISGSDRSASVSIVELIPGEHYIVVARAGGDDVPDDDAVEELRILAYARRNKGTLGNPAEQVAATLAETVAGGILTNSVWAQCEAAARYVSRLRASRRDKRATDGAEEAEGAARRAVEALGSAGVPVSASAATMVGISGIGADGTPWKIAFEAAGDPVDVQVDISGTVFDIMIGPCALDSRHAAERKAAAMRPGG